MKLLRRVPLLAALALVSVPGVAQDYHNRVNTRFNAISTGPMQATIVDVPDPKNTDAVRSAAMTSIRAVRASRAASASRVLAALRRMYPRRRDLNIGYGDVVIARSSGRLAVPRISSTRAANDLTFSLPTSGTGCWTIAQQAELGTVINIVYPILKSIYGNPSWSGTVTVLNGDNMSPIIGDPDALSGGIYNVSTNEITIAQYNTPQTRVFNLTQMMALAFRGSASISNDPWERGMARAATLITVATAQSSLEAYYGSDTIDPYDQLWLALDRYELLNQAPLGNDRFYPTSKASSEANTSDWPLMLIPRLMMSGTAWVKVATEDPSFLRTFNTLYYQAVTSDASVQNSVPALKQLATQALAQDGITQVEGNAFADWYNRQYVLDTSITQGVKLYAMPHWLRPASSSATDSDEFAVGVILYYYRTALGSSGASDEVNLSGTCYPIYWDSTFTSRLYLGAQYERVDILQGTGTVAPTFPDVIGGDSSLHGRMRIAMDFPVNGESVRLYVAPRCMGWQDTPNNFWGTIVGADDGTLHMETDTGVTADMTVQQGAFSGIVANGSLRRSRATLTFTPTSGSAVTRKVVVGPSEYIPVFYVADPVASRTHTFAAGAAMVSFPIRPLRPKAADALLDPTTGLPLFTDSNLLMAQWRQNLSTTDKYVYYPSMEPLQPGKAYWTNFASATQAKITGSLLTQDPYVSIGLMHGWNQIGNPYEGSINTSDLQFQYMADNTPVSLDQAITNGWISSQTVTGGTAVVWSYDPINGYAPATTLEPWSGYWIRVLVTEGVTITYPRPSSVLSVASRAAKTTTRKATTSTTSGGWSVSMLLRGPDDLGATAVLGQVPGASVGNDAKLDAELPPAPARSVPSLAFVHTDWGSASGNYYSDIHQPGSSTPWVLTAATPVSNGKYTISWQGVAAMPRSTRLVLVDLTSNRRLYLNSASSYTFTASGSSRSFRIETENRSRTALRIQNVSLRTTRGTGARTVTLGFELTSGADVTARILGHDGRSIRTLSTGRATSAGNSTVIWDTRDDRSISVPSGAYLAEITARTSDGDLARVIVPVTVVR